jgi:hypothetical protein
MEWLALMRVGYKHNKLRDLRNAVTSLMMHDIDICTTMPYGTINDSTWNTTGDLQFFITIVF